MRRSVPCKEKDGIMDKKILIAPSLLSADFADLAKDVKKVETAGADWLHVDVMDGAFVPNVTIGPLVVKAIRKHTKLPLDVHLMIEKPQDYIKPFAEAGSDIITFHIEACKSPKDLVKQIHSLGKKAGVSIRPKTGLDAVKDILGEVDMVLLMTVEPGFAGQKFMKDVLPKIEKLRAYYKGDIQVDGGVNKDTAGLAIKAGANILVAGTAVFGETDYKKAIEKLRGA